jgi:hypothetical protein
LINQPSKKILSSPVKQMIMGSIIVLLFKQPKELNVEVPGKGRIDKLD